MVTADTHLALATGCLDEDHGGAWFYIFQDLTGTGGQTPHPTTTRKLLTEAMGHLLRSRADLRGSLMVEVESQEQLELLPSLRVATRIAGGRAEEVSLTSCLESGKVDFWLNDTEPFTPEMAAAKRHIARSLAAVRRRQRLPRT